MKYRCFVLVPLLAVLLIGGTGMVPAASENSPDGAAEAAEAGAEEKAPVKRIKMVARNWSWTPEEIRVKKGTRVVIDFESEDANHGFQLKAYKIKVNLPQDKRAQIEFVADKSGSFVWRCSRPCGNGCAKMTGTLVVGE